MSYAEKPDEITKDEWMEKLNNLHVQRADMNRLIMNYLVTGNGLQQGCYLLLPSCTWSELYAEVPWHLMRCSGFIKMQCKELHTLSC